MFRERHPQDEEKGWLQLEDIRSLVNEEASKLLTYFGNKKK